MFGSDARLPIDCFTHVVHAEGESDHVPGDLDKKVYKRLRQDLRQENNDNCTSIHTTSTEREYENNVKLYILYAKTGLGMRGQAQE